MEIEISVTALEGWRSDGYHVSQGGEALMLSVNSETDDRLGYLSPRNCT